MFENLDAVDRKSEFSAVLSFSNESSAANLASSGSENYLLLCMALKNLT